MESSQQPRSRLCVRFCAVSFKTQNQNLAWAQPNVIIVMIISLFPHPKFNNNLSTDFIVLYTSPHWGGWWSAERIARRPKVEERAGRHIKIELKRVYRYRNRSKERANVRYIDAKWSGGSITSPKEIVKCPIFPQFCCRTLRPLLRFGW